MTAVATASAQAPPLSTFDKLGVDRANGSTAAAGAAAGTTAAGRTLDWVLSYRNTSGSAADVTLADPITGNQRYVPGSLRTPPGLDGRWSTDGGASFAGTEPGSGVNAVGATGTSIDGSTGLTDLFSPPAQSFSAGASQGDGWEALFVGDNIYNVHHHRPTGPATTTLDCHVNATGALCPGYPVLFVSEDAGDDFGDGADTLGTASFTNAAVDRDAGRIYYPVSVEGDTSIGVACADVVNNESCGYTELGDADFASVPGQNGIGGGALVGTRYYVVGGSEDAPIYCYDISTEAACAGWTPVDSQPGYAPANTFAASIVSLESWGGYLFTKTITSSAAGSPVNLGCVVEATGQVCPGFPKLGYTTFVSPGVGSYNTTTAPVVDAAGTLTGVCGQNGVGTFMCWDLQGNALGPAPWSNQTPAAFAGYSGYGSPLLIGTRLYVPWNTAGSTVGTYTCWDYAANAACAGFAPVSSGQDVRPYTIRQDPYNPDCLWALGDAGLFEVFSATFGGSTGCKVGNAQIALTPAEFYCDGSAGHVDGWGELRIGGVTAADYDAIALTITDANGDPVPGWTNRVISSSDVPVDLSSIPYSGSTETLNLAVVISWGAHPAVPATASATYVGDPVQLCFKTVVGAAQCATAQTLENAATAVTAVAGGPTDGPAGRSSGTARFDLPADPNVCLWDLGIVKRPLTERLVPGKEARYELTVQNHGPDTARPVVVKDRLPSGLSFVSASAGCAHEAQIVTCTLASLASGATGSFEVVARVGRSVAHSKKNVAVVCADKLAAGPDPTECPPPGTCELGEQCAEQPCATPATARSAQAAADPRANQACAKIPIAPRLKIRKRVSKREVPAGGLLVYRIRTTNPSTVAAHNVRTCDRLPAGLVYVRSKPKARLIDGRPCWTVKRLGPGRSRTYKLTVRALNRVGRTLTNTATATADDARPDRARKKVRVVGGGVLGAGEERAGGVTG